MTDNKLKNLCDECGQPLFLNKEECKKFIEAKMKQGYLVCKCCGAKQTLDQQRK